MGTVSQLSLISFFLLNFIVLHVQSMVMARSTSGYKVSGKNLSMPDYTMMNTTEPVNYTSIRWPDPPANYSKMFMRIKKPPVDFVPFQIRAEPPDPLFVPIKFTIFPIFLENVDVRLATCRIHLYVVKEWTDPRIAWDPVKQKVPGGIRIDPKVIWTPDFEPYNGLKVNSGKQSSDNTQAFVSPKGKVRLSQFYILTTYGQRSKGLFMPTCEMRFASWTAGRFKIINTDNFDFSRYTPSLQWSKKTQYFKQNYDSGFPEVRAKIVFVGR